MSGNETFTRGDKVYSAFAHFDADRTGSYPVTLSRGGREVILSRSLGETFRSMVPVALTGVAAALVGVIGLVLLIVGLVRRHRAGRSGGPGPGAPPPGSWPGSGGTWPPTGSTWQPTGSAWQPTGSAWQPTGTWQGAAPPRDRSPNG